MNLPNNLTKTFNQMVKRLHEVVLQYCVLGLIDSLKKEWFSSLQNLVNWYSAF